MDAIGTQLRDPMNSGLTQWQMAVKNNKWTSPPKSGGISHLSTRFSLSMEMSRLTRDGTAETVSRDQIIRRERGQGNIHFPFSADHEQDWLPYSVDPPLAICNDHTYIPIAICKTGHQTIHPYSKNTPSKTIEMADSLIKRLTADHADTINTVPKRGSAWDAGRLRGRHF